MARRARWVDTLGLTIKDAAALGEDPPAADFFEVCARAIVEGGMDVSKAAQDAAKLLLNAGAREANERNCSVEALGIDPTQVAELVLMREAGDLGSTAVDELFVVLCDVDESARAAADRLNLVQVSDAGSLDAWIDEALEAHTQAAEDFAAGKDAAMGRIMGHVMKASGGSADAGKVRARLIERLR
jgi:aspartyl-tRNA(Asn)/glutamyl-tRNA(Gln) amidotransferase subunit B